MLFCNEKLGIMDLTLLSIPEEFLFVDWNAVTSNQSIYFYFFCHVLGWLFGNVLIRRWQSCWNHIVMASWIYRWGCASGDSKEILPNASISNALIPHCYAKYEVLPKLQKASLAPVFYVILCFTENGYFLLGCPLHLRLWGLLNIVLLSIFPAKCEGVAALRE